MKRPAGKKSKKGAAWKFTLDLTHPVEDGILDSASFVSLLAVVTTLGEIQFKSCPPKATNEFIKG